MQVTARVLYKFWRRREARRGFGRIGIESETKLKSRNKFGMTKRQEPNRYIRVFEREVRINWVRE